MMDKQENILRMYYAVSAVCETNSEIWQENEVFIASYRKFQAKIPEIQKFKDVLKMELIATETFKSIDRIELEEMAFYISSKILSFAKDSANEQLYSDIHANRNNLLKASDNELVTICSIFSQYAIVHLNALTKYEVSAESISEFQQFLTFFSSNLNRLRLSTTKNKSTQDILKKYYKEADELLKNKLDIEIEFFKNSDPDFYNRYKVAREIINLEEEVPQNLTEKLLHFTN
jgi:hypothetical protein